jgi:hypothetical protein
MYPFRDGSFAVRNGWYVAAFAHELTDAPMQRTIVGLPIALYRKADGDGGRGRRSLPASQLPARQKLRAR